MKSTVLMIPVAALMAMEQAINATLALDPNTLRRLVRLNGKVIAIDILGTGVKVYLAPQTDGLRLMGHYDGAIDTTLRGAPLSLLRMSSGKAGEGLFSGEVTIDGDVETGQQLQRILHGLDIDWEEHISRLTGDVIGHQIGQTVRGFADFGRNALATFGLNLGEYLQEERNVLPANAQLAAFINEVDTLRMATDRLEARIKRLHHALHENANGSKA
jgi:ubiquinone biosynthesis protein UbiJ